jgi:DNA-nicking Smr family endonuclease
MEDEVIEIPIDGVLDLHTFSPKEVKDLVPNYLDECVKHGITEIQIIHGKGIGVLRQIVHSILDRHPAVISYQQGNSWGSTFVTLKK